jgi:hypothetical protein
MGAITLQHSEAAIYKKQLNVKLSFNIMNSQKNKSDEIILHILRLALINIRNMTYGGRRTKDLVRDWAEMIHNAPALLLETKFDEGALRWFLDVQVRTFINDYPMKEDGAYQQILPLFKELEDLLN